MYYSIVLLLDFKILLVGNVYYGIFLYVYGKIFFLLFCKFLLIWKKDNSSGIVEIIVINLSIWWSCLLGYRRVKVVFFKGFV